MSKTSKIKKRCIMCDTIIHNQSECMCQYCEGTQCGYDMDELPNPLTQKNTVCKLCKIVRKN